MLYVIAWEGGKQNFEAVDSFSSILGAALTSAENKTNKPPNIIRYKVI